VPRLLAGFGFFASQSANMASASSLVAWAAIKTLCAAASRSIATRSAGLELPLGVVTAFGTSFGVKAAAARVPAPTMLPTAATVRNGAAWDPVGSADVFVGGVLITRLAWVMGSEPFVTRVRAEAGVRTFPSACFCGTPFS
jgi:hypothetical protein